MKEKCTQFLRSATEWLAELEQATKNRAIRRYKIATAICLIVGLGAVVMIGNLVAASDEMFLMWIVTTLRLLFRGVLIVTLIIIVRFAYRVGMHAWEQWDNQKQPFQK